MEIVGYFLALLIGVSLGLMGSGGSILTVPLLVYFFKIDAVLAVAYSLFLVGATSFIGAIRKFYHDALDIKNILYFGLPSLIAVYLTRKFFIPLVPNEIFFTNDFSISKNTLTLILFAFFMLFAAVKIIFARELNVQRSNTNFLQLGFYGFAIGCITALVGAGGGFLIIPALVLYTGIDMKRAVGTSLGIIAINSLIGFLGDVQTQGEKMDWMFLLSLTSLSVAGIFIGSNLSRFFSSQKLKQIFGWFVLCMAIIILINEILKINMK